MQDILEKTLSDVACSVSSGVTAITDWDTETGLTRVQEIVETDFALSYSVTRLMFDPHCILFLRLISFISHEDIQNSPALEKPAGTIYNVIYGPDGNRGVGFFRRVLDCLTRLQAEAADAGPNDETQCQVLLHITEAILSILVRVQEATFKSELKDVVEDLRSCFLLNDGDHCLTNPDIRLARENLFKIRDLFVTGDFITANEQKSRGCTSKALQCQSAAATDFPGELSESGPRHDNDHATISDIRILPTLSEILYSRRLDFLPTRDTLHSPDGHHEKGIRRLLDTHFRLLREDTSGVLRDSLRVILYHWETIVKGTRWQDKRKLLRAHCPTPVRVYYDAQIQRVKPDRIKGMEVEVEFNQVPRAKSMNARKRKQLWHQSRGLNEGGALLALIDAEVEEDMTVIFLQVSKRNIEPTTDENSPNGVFDLVSDAKRAMITLRLTTPPARDDLDGIIHLVNNQLSSSRRSFILVEFPALLYNSFEGILRCLQTLYKDPRHIPLTKWIAPQDRYPREYTTTYGYRAFAVDSPACLENVTLDLSSIPVSPEVNEQHNEATPLTFSASRDFKVMCEQLSERTTLDMGQARAMILAFKNNLALIQGPPGTGKSYVGIQIAKCLLANRTALHLGPVLCV